MINFCTLFDSYYIHKGIALYMSLAKHCPSFHLYVMAFDKDSLLKLQELAFPHMTVECMCDHEDDFFLELKEKRNKAEYCWTCGPYVIHYFLTHYGLPNITYLDSDLFFIGDPNIAISEIAENSIAITEQGISDKNAQLYGKYCVQFMYFKNDKNGLAALEWWRDSCFEWCYQKFEEGKFGDQKYLDYFPEKFENVYIIKNPGVGIAPWNYHRYKYENGGKTLLYKGNKYPSVFFHMHGIKSEIEDSTLKMSSIDCFINNKDRALFFNPYAELNAIILSKYFGKNISSYRILGIPQWRYLEIKVRSALKRITFFRSVYYNFFRPVEHNHGTKL